MTTFGKVGLVVASVGTIGTATTYGLYEFNRETIGDKLKGTLLTKEPTDKDKWVTRATDLKGYQQELSEDLKKIQTGNQDGSDIQAWCETNLKNKFTSEDSQLFKEIQRYCVYNIKEKIGTVITDWATESDKKFKEGEQLSDEMQKIKDALTKQSSPDKNALKNWCELIFKKPFKGETDQGYLDAKKYCTT